jgi:cobalt-zinc-cadmium resistance protein CzcA
MEILADLKPRGSWRFADKDALVDTCRRSSAAMPGLPTNFSQVIQDNVEEALSGAKGEIAVKVFGPDLDVLKPRSEQIAAVLNRIQGAADVAAAAGGRAERGRHPPAPRALARYDINVTDVSTMIQTALAAAPSMRISKATGATTSPCA